MTNLLAQHENQANAKKEKEKKNREKKALM
jgi:hypothetical protein